MARINRQLASTLTKGQLMMIEDGFPRELFRTAEQRRQWWDKHPPRAMPVFTIVPKSVDPEAQRIADEIKAQKVERSLLKLKNFLARKKHAPLGVKQALKQGMRWSATHNKFIQDVFTAPQASASQSVRPERVERGQGANLSPRAKVPPKPAGDKWMMPPNVDVVKFAKANDCWDEKYRKLPNPGLIRMNVTNRMRNKIAKGHKVVTP